MGPGLSSPGGQGNPVTNEPTIENIREKGYEALLTWIQQVKPTLLSGEDLENFKKEHITGDVFLDHASDRKFFKEECNLPAGPSDGLAKLASEVIGKEIIGKLSNQTAGKKRMGDETDAPESKRNRQEDPLSKLATRASERLDSDPPVTDEHHFDHDANLHRVSKIEEQLTANIHSVNLLRAQIAKEEGLLKQDSEPPVNNRKRKASALDPPLLQTAEAAKQRRIDNINIMAKWNKKTLSDPKTMAELVFPFVGAVMPRRFAVTNGRWQFAGREVFQTLLDDVDCMRQSENLNALWVYGTRGYGKSHLLAALVCYLSARGDDVVYIPDCRAFTEAPEVYLQSALLFTWTDDKTQDEIFPLTKRDDLTDFLLRRKPLFVIDQTNGFVDRNNPLAHQYKQAVKQWLSLACATSKVVYSTSANNLSFHETAGTQNNFARRNLFGGYTQAEMKSWWQRHSDLQIALSAREEFKQTLKEQVRRSQWEDRWQRVKQDFRQSELEEFTKSKGKKGKLTKKQTKDFEDLLSERFEHSDWKDIEQAEATELEETMKKEFASAQWAEREQSELEQFERDQKAKLERLTGRIPLLLESSKSGTEFHLDNDGFREMFRLARKFVRNVRKQHNGDWDDYRTFTEGCLSGAYVDPSLLDEHLIDHRFFYEDKGIGHCVCDIVRRAVSSELLRSQAPFSASQFLASITTC